MKKIFLLITLIFISSFAFSQNGNLAREYFEKATKELQLGNINEASKYIEECKEIAGNENPDILWLEMQIKITDYNLKKYLELCKQFMSISYESDKRRQDVQNQIKYLTEFPNSLIFDNLNRKYIERVEKDYLFVDIFNRDGTKNNTEVYILTSQELIEKKYYNEFGKTIKVKYSPNSKLVNKIKYFDEDENTIIELTDYLSEEKPSIRYDIFKSKSIKEEQISHQYILEYNNNKIISKKTEELNTFKIAEEFYDYPLNDNNTSIGNSLIKKLTFIDFHPLSDYVLNNIKKDFPNFIGGIIKTAKYDIKIDKYYVYKFNENGVPISMKVFENQNLTKIYIYDINSNSWSEK